MYKDGNRLVSTFKDGERVTDDELREMGREAGFGPAYFEGLERGIRIREAFRKKHGRFPELGEC
jgi:hypothetical protein